MDDDLLAIYRTAIFVCCLSVLDSALQILGKPFYLWSGRFVRADI